MLLFCAAFLWLDLALALTQCPQAEGTYTSAAGANYAMCIGTDLQGPSIAITPDIASTTACAELCDNDARCVRAVYDTQTANCHIKSNTDNLNWATDNRFNVIRSTSLKACSNAETAYTSSTGSNYSICAGSDLQGPSLAIIPNVASTTACAAVCANYARCLRAIFDTQTGNCHIKSNTDILTWAADSRFDRIRLRNNLAEATVISRCPFQTGTYTSQSGTNYQTCPGTDYRGVSQQIIQNVADVPTCAKTCGTTNGCTKAVFDTVNNVCHIKSTDPNETLTWALNKQFTVIQAIPTYNPVTQGQWTDFIRLPVVPVAAYVVPSYPTPSRMLLFSSWGDDTFGGPGGFTQFADYNFVTGAVSQRTVANTQHDMFCPGISALPDGRIMISGGGDAAVTSLYDPASDAFVRGPDMNMPRGYQTSVTLSNGKVFTIGGSYSGGISGQNGVPYKNGEVYDPVNNTWTVLTGADLRPMLTGDAGGPWRTDNHGWLFAWKDGSVFQAGPSMTQHWYGTSGTGSVSTAGTRPGAPDQMCGVNVMYDIGKILTVGGSPSYTDSDAVAMAHITTLGKVGAVAQIERVADMSWPRGFANGVVLPDGTVLVTGGQQRSVVFTDDGGVWTPELFNPTKKNWAKMAPESVSRNYHSEALLLPDARVWSGGGGLCYRGARGTDDTGCDLTVNHADGQIFSPPYLFNSDGTLAARPVISSVSNTTPKVGSTITVTMSNNNAATFSLIRMGSATHSINSDQRRVPLTSKAAGTKSTIALPSDSGILIPGHYYLFALNRAGVPSIARTIRVTL